MVRVIPIKVFHLEKKLAPIMFRPIEGVIVVTRKFTMLMNQGLVKAARNCLSGKWSFTGISKNGVFCI